MLFKTQIEICGCKIWIEAEGGRDLRTDDAIARGTELILTDMIERDDQVHMSNRSHDSLTRLMQQ